MLVVWFGWLWLSCGFDNFRRVYLESMESSEMVEMYRTLLPIARVDFGKEVLSHLDTNLSNFSANCCNKCKFIDSAKFLQQKRILILNFPHYLSLLHPTFKIQATDWSTCLLYRRPRPDQIIVVSNSLGENNSTLEKKTIKN